MCFGNKKKICHKIEKFLKQKVQKSKGKMNQQTCNVCGMKWNGAPVYCGKCQDLVYCSKQCVRQSRHNCTSSSGGNNKKVNNVIAAVDVILQDESDTLSLQSMSYLVSLRHKLARMSQNVTLSKIQELKQWRTEYQKTAVDLTRCSYWSIVVPLLMNIKKTLTCHVPILV